MAFEATDWYYDYLHDPALVYKLRRSQLTRVGSASDDAEAYRQGYARLWLDDPVNPFVYGRKLVGTPTLNGAEQRAEQVNVWEELTPVEKRIRITQDIEGQIAEPTARELVEDAFAERGVESTSGGASERKSDLEDTGDGDLDTFDSHITLTPPDGTGYVEAKMTTFVDIVDPWAGAPSDIYALRVGLKIITAGQEASGSSARAHMFGPKDGPSGAVLPFQQDATDPSIWWAQSQEGRYWDDPNTPASMRLLWDSGSLPVAETRQLEGYGDRYSAIVRAGL